MHVIVKDLRELFGEVLISEPGNIWTTIKDKRFGKLWDYGRIAISREGNDKSLEY